MCAQVGYKSYLSWVLILCMITTHFCNIVAVKCGRSGGGGFVYFDYVICNAFQYAGEKVGHMRHRSSSEDFKGPDRPSCSQSQMLGVWSAHVTADPLTADPKKYCVICQLAILHEGLLQCRPYRLPTSIVH